MKLIIVSLLFPLICAAQLKMDRQIALGEIAEAYEIKGDIVITNSGGKKTFLMRADADQGVKIHTSKRTLLPADTCLLTISFVPDRAGRFSREIRLVSSDSDQPYKIILSGDLRKVRKDDRTACFYFGRGRVSPVPAKELVFEAPPEPEKRDVSNKIPDPSATPNKREDPPPRPLPEKEPTPSSLSAKGLDEAVYSPNNIIFLVDVSGSMKDSTKLPLMKLALHHLIDEIRNVDKLTFITYADTIRVLLEAGNAAQREELHAAVDKLRARGMTKGKKAIFFSQQIAQKNFISGGNNQLIIATDGEFKFEREDHKLWQQRQGEKKIIMTTVAFGDEKAALKNLKELAKKGGGSFIRITDRGEAREKLLEEVQLRSLRTSPAIRAER